MASGDATMRRREMVEVVTPTRLHLGLMSFGHAEVRAFGGVGMMIDRPGLRLRMSTADHLTAGGPLADRAASFARTCAAAWGVPEAFRIEVLEAPASHVGLGSGTQLALAVAAAVRFLRLPEAAIGTAVGESRGVTVDEAVALARAVGRGRRSCVGIYGFAGGGLVMEGGRLPPPTGGPGEISQHGCFSPLLARVALPEAWRCLLFSLRGGGGLHGEAERRAFASLPPVPVEVSAELARIAVMELLPAAVEGRFDVFARAVGGYGAVAGRPYAALAAALPHTEITARLIEQLAAWGVVGAAQSSWGPTVVACCESAQSATSIAERFADTHLASRYEVTIARCDGAGARVRRLPDQTAASGTP